MKTDWSWMILIVIPDGRVFSICSSRALTVSTILTVLEPACRRISSVTASRPSSMFQVREADRRAVNVTDDDVAELADGVDSSHRADSELRLAAHDPPPRNIDVF